MIQDALGAAFAAPLVMCGLIAAVLSTIAYLPYIADTARGRTQPERATWLIWSVVSTAAFFSQLYEGATASLWFAGVQASATIVIFLMSIKRGYGAYLSRRNINLFGLTAVGLVIWYYAENALYMLLITTAISALGGAVTVMKAYRHPGSETISTWVISLIATYFAILSVGTLDIALLIYPVYLYVLYSAIFIAIRLGTIEGRGEGGQDADPVSGDMVPA